MNRKWLLATALLLPLLAARTAYAEHAENPEAEKTAGGHEGEKQGGHEGGGHEGTFSIGKVFVLQLIACLLLYLALRKWVFPILARMLNERSKKIEETYAKLERERKELDLLLETARSKLAGIEKEAQEKLDAALKEGTAQKAAILEEAGAAAARLLGKAKSEIEVERAKAIEEIRQEMVRLSLEAAERLVKQQLTAAKQDELVERFIAEIEKVRA